MKHRDPKVTGAVIVAVCLVGLVALACAYSVHVACFHPPPPVVRPDPTTARAGYCDAINATRPWISLTVVPILAMAILGFALRRWPWVIGTVAGLGCAALVANAIYANSLVSALTV
jgi:hypothetical protein